MKSQCPDRWGLEVGKRATPIETRVWKWLKATKNQSKEEKF
jgi:hypothetical protein